MKNIRYDGAFNKHFKQRVGNNQELINNFKESVELFIEGNLKSLDDHALRGKLAGKRAFSITDDIRVVYTEAGDTIAFLDIGTHDQVYK
jgi:addiction module RelE/StbE family toxin